MLAQYLKKKENVEVIEISSDDEPPQTTRIPKHTHLPLCKEEENSFTILKNARPKSTPQNTTTRSAQAESMIVEEVVYEQSENQYDYDWQINVFQAQQINRFLEHSGDRNGEVRDYKQREVEIEGGRNRECVSNNGGVQGCAPSGNLRQSILRAWMGAIVRNRSIPTNN